MSVECTPISVQCIRASVQCIQTKKKHVTTCPVTPTQKFSKSKHSFIFQIDRCDSYNTKTKKKLACADPESCVRGGGVQI